jgi:hypothetical protein
MEGGDGTEAQRAGSSRTAARIVPGGGLGSDHRQERVRAGLEQARREGRRLGRPPLAPKLRERIQEALMAPGRPGVRKIAEQFGVNASTVQQISTGLHSKPGPALAPPAQ